MGNATEVGLQIWIYAAGGAFLLGVVLVVLAIVANRAGSDYLDISLGLVGGGLAGIAGLVLAIGLIPYDSDYWKLYRVSGEVESVSNVLSESSGDLTRQPVVTLSTVDKDIIMEDSRAVNLTGKQVELTCKIHWRYQAADRYECEIYSVN